MPGNRACIVALTVWLTAACGSGTPSPTPLGSPAPSAGASTQPVATSPRTKGFEVADRDSAWKLTVPATAAPNHYKNGTFAFSTDDGEPNVICQLNLKLLQPGLLGFVAMEALGRSDNVELTVHAPHTVDRVSTVPIVGWSASSGKADPSVDWEFAYAAHHEWVLSCSVEGTEYRQPLMEVLRAMVPTVRLTEPRQTEFSKLSFLSFNGRAFGYERLAAFTARDGKRVELFSTSSIVPHAGKLRLADVEERFIVNADGNVESGQLRGYVGKRVKFNLTVTSAPNNRYRLTGPFGADKIDTEIGTAHGRPLPGFTLAAQRRVGLIKSGAPLTIELMRPMPTGPAVIERKLSPDPAKPARYLETGPKVQSAIEFDAEGYIALQRLPSPRSVMETRLVASEGTPKQFPITQRAGPLNSTP